MYIILNIRTTIGYKYKADGDIDLYGDIRIYAFSEKDNRVTEIRTKKLEDEIGKTDDPRVVLIQILNYLARFGINLITAEYTRDYPNATLHNLHGVGIRHKGCRERAYIFSTPKEMSASELEQITDKNA